MTGCGVQTSRSAPRADSISIARMDWLWYDSALDVAESSGEDDSQTTQVHHEAPSGPVHSLRRVSVQRPGAGGIGGE